MSSVPVSAQDFLRELLYPNLKDARDSDGNPVCPLIDNLDQNRGVCPYRDARFGLEKPMNLSALALVQKNYGFIVDAVAMTAAHYKHEKKLDRLAPLDLWQIWMMIYSRPIMGWLKTRRCGQAVLPQSLAMLYKVGIGFVDILSGITLYLSADDAAKSVADEHAFFDFLDFNKLLIGRSEVCAGSPGMIKQLMKTMLTAKAQAMVCRDLSYSAQMDFSQIMLGSIMARVQLKAAGKSSDIQDSSFDMRPRVRMNRIRLDSEVGRLHVSGADSMNDPLQDVVALMNRHMENLARESFEQALSTLSPNELREVLQLSNRRSLSLQP